MSPRPATRAEPRLPAHAPQEAPSISRLLALARGSLLSRMDAELERYGVNAMQFGVLKNLAEGAGQTAADLCRVMSYDTGAMTRIVDQLERRGLVQRERCREDRRVVFLRVSPQGRAQLPRLRTVGERVLEAHLAGFTPAEIDAFKGYLGRMIDNGQAQADNHQLPAGGKS